MWPYQRLYSSNMMSQLLYFIKTSVSNVFFTTLHILAVHRIMYQIMFHNIHWALLFAVQLLSFGNTNWSSLLWIILTVSAPCRQHDQCWCSFWQKERFVIQEAEFIFHNMLLDLHLRSWSYFCLGMISKMCCKNLVGYNDAKMMVERHSGLGKPLSVC